jgi:hypothetical protein
MQLAGTKTTLSQVVVVGASILAAILCAGRARAQAGTKGATYETIKVTDDKPVSKAMDVIGEKYGVMIDYMDPPYVAPQDLELVRSLHGKPLKVPYQAPKMWRSSGNLCVNGGPLRERMKAPSELHSLGHVD